MQKTPILILLTLVAGCAHQRFNRCRGDVGQFIVQQAVSLCGVPAPTNQIVRIDTQWRYSQDDKGVVIQMPREDYPSVELMLRQTFGEPRFGPTATREGGKLGMYKLAAKPGAVLQFGYDKERTQVTIVRPLTKPELRDASHKAMQDGRFWEGFFGD